MEEKAISGWEEAADSHSREEVYSFRYAQYFASREYLPGTDHRGHRVWLPHDDYSRHFLVRGEGGDVVAVGTATPASEPSLLPEWRNILDLPRLAELLAQITIISRAIVAEEQRKSFIFGELCLRLATLFLEEGYHYAVHYCAPGMVPMYERLGYRQYGRGGNLASGVYRVPMMLVADDMAWLRRVRSPFRTLNRDPEANRVWIEKAYALCPELALPPLCALAESEVMTRVRALCPALGALEPVTVRALRRGTFLSLRKGDVLAPEGIAEGSFLLLAGSLSSGGKYHSPGSTVRTGAAMVRAEEDAQVICAALEGGMA